MAFFISLSLLAPKTNADIVPAIQESAEAALPDGVIKPTSKYIEGVKIIQTYLNFWLGANTIEVDGYFGPNTEKHLTAFQKTRGIAADGIYGPNTKRELIEVYAEKLAKEKQKQQPTAVQYFVQVGAFSKLENAEQMVEKAEKRRLSGHY
ncbi:peptidoglycan-binding protein [Bacillus sp. F19]|nr:peptidoglycan-binding protein [Bacillus sp. F19]